VAQIIDPLLHFGWQRVGNPGGDGGGVSFGIVLDEDCLTFPMQIPRHVPDCDRPFAAVFHPDPDVIVLKRDDCCGDPHGVGLPALTRLPKI
jgi:hypothetical protein